MSTFLQSQLTRRRAVSIALAAVLLIVAAVFHRPLIAWFGGKPMGGSEGAAVTTHAGPFTLKATLDPDPPGTSGNALVLLISDASGKPVDDATVEVLSDMAAMGAMSEMRISASVAHEKEGRYRATFDLPMAGSWTLKSSVRSLAGNATQDFTLTVGAKGLSVAGSGGGPTSSMTSMQSSARPMVAAIQYPQAAFDALRTGVDAYERARAQLARDEIKTLTTDAKTIGEALRAASAALPNDRADAKDAAAHAAQVSDRLAVTKSVEEARKTFADLNRTFLPVVGADPHLANGWHVFECPMFEGHPRWMQRRDVAENPYMGTKMVTCGTATSFEVTAPAAASSSASPGEIDHYTCSMHPSVKQSGPGKCPICGMDLIPVTKEQQEQGVVMIDELRRQLIGVRTGRVIEGPMKSTIRAVGHITYDETSLADVNLKVRGWITKLLVNQTGQRVSRGQTLFLMYSPEIYNAEQDFLLATQGATASLGSAARQRLHLLGLADTEIDALAKSGKPHESVPIASPASGFIIEKNVVEGGSVDPGMRLYRIAALTKVWVEAEVYEADFARVRGGQSATVTLDYLPGRSYDARVAYVYPYLDEKTRTGRVRVELANKELDLRPGMYANVELAADLGTRVQVPASAIVYTGPRRLVFVDLGDGRFRPTEVKLGTEANGMYEVLSGLKVGDAVATSGVFLIAAEARISTAAKYWESTSEMDAGTAAPATTGVK